MLDHSIGACIVQLRAWHQTRRRREVLDHVVQHARHVIGTRQHNALPASCNDAVQQVLVL